ncbi:MAG TPA: hypothetical protein VMJ35_07040 [Dongiaceae bacterium]|nr:hypothetical protein [Dongiaceae bacterium]
MLLIAKAALGVGATLALSTAYVFHEGVIRVDVDENRDGGSHVHVWVPATAISGGLRVVPRHYLEHAAAQSRPYLPLIREVAKELEKYPNVELIDVRNADHEHVRITIRNGRIYVDAVDHENDIHVSVPAQTIAEVADRLEDASTGI